MTPTGETELTDALELMAVPGEPGKEGQIAQRQNCAIGGQQTHR